MEQTYSSKISIEINVDKSKVWEALINPEIIKKYLYGAETITTWKVGSPIIWKGMWEGKPYEDKGVVLEFEPQKLLKNSHWSPLSESEDKPKNYHITTYELEENNGKTTLTLTQSNSPTQKDAEDMINSGWKTILQNLKGVLENTIIGYT